MTCLNLRALFVPDSTLALLAARLTNLTSLDISNEDSHVENQLGPEASMMDLRALCLFASLQHVTVHNPKPDTIDSIAQLSSLKDLELHFWSSPGMEDDGLECLSRLAALNSLLIVHQSLSCASELPSQMEQLISDLPQASDCRPQYTEAALQRFLVALPHLKRCKAQSFLGDRLLLKRRF